MTIRTAITMAIHFKIFFMAGLLDGWTAEQL
jgi:hypothetical protein